MIPLLASEPLAGGRQPHRSVAEHGAVVDAEGFDPTLLAESEADEKAELNQLGDGEVSMEFFPERGVGDVGVPSDRAGVGQRDFLPFAELVRVGEVEQLVVFFFGEALPSSLDGALNTSILTLNGF